MKQREVCNEPEHTHTLREKVKKPQNFFGVYRFHAKNVLSLQTSHMQSLRRDDILIKKDNSIIMWLYVVFVVCMQSAHKTKIYAQEMKKKNDEHKKKTKTNFRLKLRRVMN